jgi:hypothetical protein
MAIEEAPTTAKQSHERLEAALRGVRGPDRAGCRADKKLQTQQATWSAKGN